MSNNIILKKSSIGDKVPVAGDLQYGELALNYADGNLFYKNSSNVVTTIASNKSVSVTGNVTGGNINSTGEVRATGDVLGKELWSTQSSGDEGGQVNLGIPATNTTLTGQVTIDVYQNKLRFFQGNSARGAYIDLSAAATGVGTNLLASGGGGTPGGANTYVQFNDGGAFGGNASFTYDKVFNTVNAGTFAGTLNGFGQNFKVGDDAWIGDININDTIGLKGQQNSANCYIVFGNADSVALGRSGTGPLTYGGTFSATGNISGSYFIGNGSDLTSITGANVTGTVANATFAASAYSAFAAASAIDASRVTANAQPNITSVGILTSLSVTGNITGGNVKTGNITIGTDVIRSANTIITIDPAADGALGLVIIAGNLQVTGTTTTVDSTTVTINDLMLNVANNAATSAEANGGGLGVGPVGTEYVKLYWDSAGNTWDSTHGINAVGIVTATSFSGSGAGLTSIPGANVTGTVANATLATTAATVTSNAQPNITSVGALSSLSVTGNISSGNIFTTGPAGNISGANVISATTFSATGNITGSYIIGNGSLLTGLSSGSSYSNANVDAYLPTYTGNLVSLTGAVTTTANITGNYIIGNGSQLTGLPASYSNANVAAYLPTYTGNLASLTGAVTTTANIQAGYFIGNGSQLTGIAAGGIKWTTAANTTPSSPSPGDFWYDSYTDTKYQYINDGTSNVWVDQGFPTSFSTLAVTGNILAGNVSVSTGTISLGNIVNTNGNGVGNIGASTLYFNTAFVKATSAQYADLAEMYIADQAYSPGTLVDFGGEHEISQTTQSHSTRVAGVISTDPSYIMNAGQTGDFVLPVALTGKVPCLVTGKIRKGDRLVASYIPGVAAALDLDQYAPGCIIGKSLQDHDGDSVTLIQIAVGRY